MKPAIFVDRDGTLNEEIGYLHKPEEAVLIPGSVEAISRLNARQIPVIVVTNQAGIGKGRYGWKDFHAVMDRITRLLDAGGAHVDGVYAAPHHEQGIGEYAHPDHPDRKPNPGMLMRATLEHDLDLSRSWIIGDKLADVEAGHRAGCRAALVLTGYGRNVDPSLADFVAADIGKAIDHILAGWPWEPIPRPYSR